MSFRQLVSSSSATRQGIFLAAGLTLTILGCGGSARRPNPSGTLEATEIDIAATIAGRIVSVRPQLGGAVRAGDTLVVLDTELIALQRSQTETGFEAIAAQRAVAGDGLSQAERNLEYLTLQLDRVKTLVAQGSAQQQQLDELSARHDVAAEQVDAARHQLTALDAEEAKLRAGLAVIDRQLKEGLIVAPSGGIVLLRAAQPGEIATPGKVLLRIADISRLELRVFVGATDLAKLNIGQTLPVLVDALQGEKLTGTVTWISPESEFTPKNAQTRDARLQLVYAVKVAVANPEGRLHIGMPAEVVL